VSIHDQLLDRNSWDGHINEAGLAIIKSFEGWSPSVYHCGARWTIGFGSTYDLDRNRITPAHPNIDEDTGAILLRQEVRHSEGAIRRLIKYVLNENQFSSLVSFCYNVGSGNLEKSSLRMKLNRGDVEGASAEFPKWRRSAGRILPGLVRRRVAERALFDSE
jgi:lysozyme